MSIATALTALADDVSAAKAAITAKGGTAPIGTADMADAIAAIPSGGSLPSNISKIDGGSFTVASDTICTTYRIAHSLGAIPKGVYVWCYAFTENTPYTVDRLMSWFMGFLDYTNDGTSYRHGEYMQFHRTAGGTAYVDSSYFNFAFERYATTSDFCAYNPNSSYVSGVTYNWIAWV